METMYDEEGIGLAATQVDIHQRIVVIDVSEERNQPMVLVNPKITEEHGEDGIEEGRARRVIGGPVAAPDRLEDIRYRQ